MRHALAAVLFTVMTFLSGCFLADALAGIERDESGKVIKIKGNPIGDTVFSTLGYLFPAFGWAATSATAALREYRHYQIVKSGGKDDDKDGIPDEPEKT